MDLMFSYLIKIIKQITVSVTQSIGYKKRKSLTLFVGVLSECSRRECKFMGV